MALPRSNTFESGLADTTAITTGNSGGAAGDAFEFIVGGSVITFSTAQQMNGSLSAKFAVPSATTGNVVWSPLTGSDVVNLWGRIYFRIDAFPTGVWQPIALRSSADVVRATLQFSSAGVLRVNNAAGTSIGTGAQTHLATTWYRLEWRFVGNVSTGVMEAKTFVGDSPSQFDIATGTGANTGGGASQLFVGEFAGLNTQSLTVYIDDIQINATGYPGPIGAAPIFHRMPIGV